MCFHCQSIEESPLKESEEQHLQWHASLPDDVWKEFSTKNGVNRFIDSAGQPCYEIEIEGMDENVFLKEKESWSNQTLVLPPKYQTNMEVAS